MAEEEPVLDVIIRTAPVEDLAVLFGRLSPKLILRMRAVSKAWRDKLDHWAAWSHHRNRMEPPRLLICSDRLACTSNYTLLRDYCVDSLDLGSGELRPVLRFTDNENYEFDEYDLVGRGRRGAPFIDEFRVDYQRMDRYGRVDREPPPLLVHGSADGLLLVSSLDGWHVTNPVTRQWLSVPDLSGMAVVAFYEHALAGDYRVLCFLPQEETYGVLTVGSQDMRLIGRPIWAVEDADHGLALGVDESYLSPSILFLHNYSHRLLWPPQQSQGYHMLVFDIVSEEFRWKMPPPVIDQAMSLLELPTGHLGLSVSGLSNAAVELWRLEDYQTDVWVRLYRIELALHQMPVLQEEGAWIASVLTEEGDVLIQSKQRLLHCDRDGNLLRQFSFHHLQRLYSVKHMLRESLVLHPMFREPKIQGATEPLFFHGLCSD